MRSESQVCLTLVQSDGRQSARCTSRLMVPYRIMRTSLSHRLSVHISHSHRLLFRSIIKMSISQTASFGKPESKFVKIFVKLEKQAFISCVKNHRSGRDLEVDSNPSTSQHFDEMVYLLSHATWLHPWWSFNPSAESLMRRLLLCVFAKRQNCNPSWDSVEEKHDKRKVKLIVSSLHDAKPRKTIYSCSNRYY